MIAQLLSDIRWILLMFDIKRYRRSLNGILRHHFDKELHSINAMDTIYSITREDFQRAARKVEGY